MGESALEQPQEDRRGQEETQGRPQDEQKQSEPYSHVLMLADGTRHEWAADDANPHAPVPTEINGVPVVSIVHAYTERSENE